MVLSAVSVANPTFQSTDALRSVPELRHWSESEQGLVLKLGWLTKKTLEMLIHVLILLAECFLVLHPTRKTLEAN